MKIARLQAENIKRLHVIDITPDPDSGTVVISGKNGQGKTSVLDAIMFALGGAAAMKSTPHPIREGETQASVVLDLGDIIITRTFGEPKSSLTVMSKDGAKYGTPQKFLDEKLGALSFDPFEFARQDGKTQLATLLRLVQLPFDPEQLARERKEIFDTRTEIGRDVRKAEALLQTLPVIDEEDLPDSPLSMNDVLNEQDLYNEQVEMYKTQQRRVADTQTKLDNITEEAKALEQKLNDLRQAWSETNQALSAHSEILERMSMPEDIDFRAKFEIIETVNKKFREKEERDYAVAAYEALKTQYDEKTEELEALDSTKAEALKNATMPLQGLAFDEDGVTYNGQVLSQCSSAEQLRVSVAMAMALNPSIKVIRILDGSLLDSDNMALINSMALENDFQVWIECVDESGTLGFVLEDGEVKA